MCCQIQATKHSEGPTRGLTKANGEDSAAKDSVPASRPAAAAEKCGDLRGREDRGEAARAAAGAEPRGAEHGAGAGEAGPAAGQAEPRPQPDPARPRSSASSHFSSVSFHHISSVSSRAAKTNDFHNRFHQQSAVSCEERRRSN